jgi:hypothetical protein
MNKLLNRLIIMKQTLLATIFALFAPYALMGQGTSITVSKSQQKGQAGGEETEMLITLKTSTIDHWTFAMASYEKTWQIKAEKLTGENIIEVADSSDMAFTAWLYSSDYQVDMYRSKNQGWMLSSPQAGKFLLKRSGHPCGRAFSLYKLDGGTERLLMKIKNKAPASDCDKEDWNAHYIMGAPPVEGYIEALALWLSSYDYHLRMQQKDGEGKGPGDEDEEGKEEGSDNTDGKKEGKD